jgi:hypothetical protein
MKLQEGSSWLLQTALKLVSVQNYLYQMLHVIPGGFIPRCFSWFILSIV